jgi:hypothetical protein
MSHCEEIEHKLKPLEKFISYIEDHAFQNGQCLRVPIDVWSEPRGLADEINRLLCRQVAEDAGWHQVRLLDMEQFKVGWTVRKILIRIGVEPSERDNW